MKSHTRVTGPARRQHDRSFKSDLVEQSLRPGASVSAIALKAGINANLLFKWRRDHVRAHGAAAPHAATLLPVCVIPQVATTRRVPPAPATRASRPGVIELEIAGAQLRLHGGVDEATLIGVLRALRQSA